jgi:ribosomal 30S subunit maturation factor RimM
MSHPYQIGTIVTVHGLRGVWTVHASWQTDSRCGWLRYGVRSTLTGDYTQAWQPDVRPATPEEVGAGQLETAGWHL